MMTEYMILIFGIINGRHFINVACVGLDADVANNISWIRKKKWIPGKPALQCQHFVYFY